MITEILAVQPVWKIKNRYQIDIPDKYLNEEDKYKVFNLAVDIEENDPNFAVKTGEVIFNEATKSFKCISDKLTVYIFYGTDAKTNVDAQYKNL